MMKNFNKYFWLTLIALSFSCTDLEEDTSSLLATGKIETLADIEANVAPIYRTLFQTNLDPHNLRTATYGADDITTWSAGNKAPLRVFDRFDYGSGENSDIVWLPTAWDGYWKVIYYANTFLDGLKASSADAAILQAAGAEARVFRAYAYLNLVKIHGNMPLILDGVLPTGEEQRATVLENYEQIESDLLFAEQYLPEPGQESVGRVSAGFAKTVLADLYLTWAGWPVKDASKYSLAANKAKEVIDYGYYQLLPFAQLWAEAGGDGRETIFSLKLPSDRSIFCNFGTAFTFHQGRGFSDCFPEITFFHEFPAGPRKDFTFLTDIPNRVLVNNVITPGNPATKPWLTSDRQHPMYRKYIYAEELVSFNRPRVWRSIHLYRYAEVLLIYAEAQARVGENASSIEALNQVKRRAAGLNYLTPDVGVDVTTATPNEIVDEKGWELAAENKRWFDLVRTERVAEMAAKRDLYSDLYIAEPVTLVRTPTEAQYIAPIPFSTISLSKLVQNPEGFKVQ